MNSQRVLIALTLANAVILMVQCSPLRPAEATATPQVLRGTGLELVDEQGRLRAQLKIEPSGTGTPETVIFRLITSDGKPRVKLTTSDTGSGLMLLGDSDTTHTILQADGARTSLKLRNNEAAQQVIKP